MDQYQKYKGQILGATSTGETREIQVDEDGILKIAGRVDIYAINVVSATQDSLANATNVITIAGVAGQSIYIEAIEVVISGASAGNDINVLLKDIIKLLQTPKPDPPKVVKRVPSKKVEAKTKRGTQQ